MAQEKTPNSLLTQTLEGVLERITFQNDENGYTIAKILPKGKIQPVTIVGTLAGAQVGESLLLNGLWTNHHQYGRQFEVKSYQVRYPATLEGIRKYLGSGLIKGVGPVTARKIVDHFGLKTLDVLDQSPEKILEVPGIGPSKVDLIGTAWI
ncbi:MAG TPA: ATP-dependent RecD-like DNA helicase, partial [Anaerolineaceae bacterium]|nr:ATP-dependent RecD-like DNA helicase [Anaerolineaceae bacterium]